nr:hypothetical protein CFP56_48093 [Quercus suber]
MAMSDYLVRTVVSVIYMDYGEVNQLLFYVIIMMMFLVYYFIFLMLCEYINKYAILSYIPLYLNHMNILNFIIKRDKIPKIVKSLC